MTISPAPPIRRRLSWRDALTDAADLALLGIFVLIAAILVLPLGGALATASFAVRSRCVNGGLPPLRDLLRHFARALLPGAGFTAVLLAGAALLLTDVRAVARGVVPGGGPMVLATALIVLVALGLLGLIVIAAAGSSWRAAARSAAITAWRHPARLAAAAGVGALALLLGLIFPVTTPLVLGFWLYALHVTARSN